jgi:cell division septal protein FtsQ
MLPLTKKKDKGPLRKKKQKWQPTHLQLQLIVGTVLLAVIALLVTAIWYGTRVPSLQIMNVEVVGGQTIPHAVIEEKVNAELVGAYLQLIPNRFMPLYPKSKIAESILTLDRVKNVHVELTGDQTLTVVFDEHVPYALWCESIDTELCLFMDKNGFAFAPAPELEGSAFVRYTDEGAVPSKDVQGFESSFVKETEEFVTLLEDQLSLYTTHVQRKSTYDVEYTISGGGVIKVSQAIPMQESFENLQTILTSEEFKHIEPGAFQYIDLRFGDKVFVNEAPLPGETASTTTATTSIPL